MKRKQLYKRLTGERQMPFSVEKSSKSKIILLSLFTAAIALLVHANTFTFGLSHIP
jgi:hypothetical protein